MTWLRFGRSRIRIPTGAWYFSVLQNIHTASGAHPTSYSVITGTLSLWGGGLKLPEIDHSFPSSAEFKNEWSSSYTPPACVQDVCGGELRFFYFEFQPSNDPACGDTFAQTVKFHAGQWLRPQLRQHLLQPLKSGLGSPFCRCACKRYFVFNLPACLLKLADPSAMFLHAVNSPDSFPSAH